jgi:catechol 2,3-dioxygenase-like lactoylglutathione lyase family enzyme
MPILIERLDHLVLIVRDIERTCAFYEQALGFRREVFGEGRVALKFGRQKINLHPHPTPHQPLVADVPVPGTGDLCFITTTPMPDVVAHLKAVGVAIVEGPVARTGALGSMTSVYVRDPDRNLVEIAAYDRQG